jgi:hypothetical protein
LRHLPNAARILTCIAAAARTTPDMA